ncbi:hypothetical protein [Nocardia asiatica]|uniref:hypothetical protein n=1 Tax=Nocardia asiatica TaxID=209252 RepID=UPI003EDFCDAD
MGLSHGYRLATGSQVARPGVARRPGGLDAIDAYRDRMGVIGELFPGKKLTHEGSEDSDGQAHTPRFDIDLDTGVVRVPRSDRAATAQRGEDRPEQA